MSDTKFTPGPWFVVKGDEWTSGIATETDKQGVWEVASVNIRRDESDANKHLIAAAPDLYAALERAHEHLEYCGYGDAWESSGAYDKGGLDDKIEAALAKARGES